MSRPSHRQQTDKQDRTASPTEPFRGVSEPNTHQQLTQRPRIDQIQHDSSQSLQHLSNPQTHNTNNNRYHTSTSTEHEAQDLYAALRANASVYSGNTLIGGKNSNVHQGNTYNKVDQTLASQLPALPVLYRQNMLDGGNEGARIEQGHRVNFVGLASGSGKAPSNA